MLPLLCHCGARSGLGFLSSADDSGHGGNGPVSIGVSGTIVVPGAGTVDGGGGNQGAKPSTGGARAIPAGGSTGVTGGAEHVGGAAHAGSAAAMAGAGGTALQDDPTTLGDDRPGWVQCRGNYDAAGHQIPISCRSPEVCCYQSGSCVSDASQCSGPSVLSCDGSEDCPASQGCCSGECVGKCMTRIIRHMACGGPCADNDGDWIPDAVDACIISQFEDGKGPFPEDGCSDYDGDGVRDGLDKCPKEMENGLPPIPDDGCP